MDDLEVRIMKHLCKCSIFSFVCVLMVFMAGICQAGEELYFRFRPGDKFSLISITDTNKIQGSLDEAELSQAGPESAESRFNPGDASPAMQQILLFRDDLDIEEVESDGCAWAKYTFRQVTLKVRGKGTSVDYDSDAVKSRPALGDTSAPGGTGEARKLNKFISVPLQIMPWVSVIDESFYLRITPRGRITNINGLAAVVGNAKSGFPNIPIKKQLVGAVELYITEDRIKRAMEDKLMVFPDVNTGPVSIGDTWRRSQRMDAEGITIERIFRLKEIRLDGIEIVDVNLIAFSVSGVGPIVIGSMKAQRDVSSKGVGRIEIEQSSGQILSSTLTQDMVEKVSFLPEGVFRRPPPSPAPNRSHIVTTFRMVRRDSGPPPASPAVRPPAEEANQP